MKDEFPVFRPRFPWWGADLQTVRNTLLPPPPTQGTGTIDSVVLPLDDGTGDALVGALERPPVKRLRSLVILVHGMGGSAESPYMLASARYHFARGHPVLRLDLRGAGAARRLCRFEYHAGRSEDLAAALRALPREHCPDGVFLIGYSLGANILLKFLAEQGHGAAVPVLGAVSVSAPIDLAAAAQRFLAPRNRLYHRVLLGRLKLDSLAPEADRTEAERRIIQRVQSVLEFDDRITAPRNGFTDAAEYYRFCAARPFMGQIQIPTLVIHALDDPWIPGELYCSYPWSENPLLTPLLPERGGHLGFHGQGHAVPWFDVCAGMFFDWREELRPGEDAGEASLAHPA